MGLATNRDLIKAVDKKRFREDLKNPWAKKLEIFQKSVPKLYKNTTGPVI